MLSRIEACHSRVQVTLSCVIASRGYGLPLMGTESLVLADAKTEIFDVASQGDAHSVCSIGIDEGVVSLGPGMGVLDAAVVDAHAPDSDEVDTIVSSPGAYAIREACGSCIAELALLLADMALRPAHALPPVDHAFTFHVPLAACQCSDLDLAPVPDVAQVARRLLSSFDAFARAAAAYNATAVALSASGKGRGTDFVTDVTERNPDRTSCNDNLPIPVMTTARHRVALSTYSLAVTPRATYCFVCNRQFPRRARCFSLDGASDEHYMCFECHGYI